MNIITNLIYKRGLLAMFIIILLEYACFPVSSEIVLPFSGAIASMQHISFFVILPLSIIAGMIGTSICYVIGLFGGNKIINSISNRFPSIKNGIDASQTKFHRYGALAVCFGRVIPICRTYIAFIAGASRQRYYIFFVYSLIGISVWNTLLIGMGYFLRERWRYVEGYYHEYKIVLVPVVVVAVVGWCLIRWRRRKVVV